MIKFIGKFWFLFGIIAAIVCGYFFSGFGRAVNQNNITRTAVIVMLFFIAGVTLPSDSIRSDLKEYRLHIFIQTFIFIFIPGVVYLVSLVFKPIFTQEMLIGLYTLACLPTTISSCIVFTQISGGNVVGSMFNSAAANILGVFVSPLLLSFLIQGVGAGFDPTQFPKIFFSLGVKMLAPVAAGQVLRYFIRKWVLNMRSRLSTVSNILIIIIIFLSFSKSAADPEFLSDLRSMPVPFLLLAVLHIVFVFAAYQGSKLFRFSRKSRIAAMYTASQKTAAMGIPFATAFFSYTPEILGIVLLFIVFYHSWQLIAAGVIRTLPFVREGK